jgi:hypothetical protein
MNARSPARISATLVALLVLGSPALAACTLPTAQPQSPTPPQGPAQLPTGGATIVAPGAYHLPPHDLARPPGADDPRTGQDG